MRGRYGISVGLLGIFRIQRNRLRAIRTKAQGMHGRAEKYQPKEEHRQLPLISHVSKDRRPSQARLKNLLSVYYLYMFLSKFGVEHYGIEDIGTALRHGIPLNM